jgi:hypothetical protein
LLLGINFSSRANRAKSFFLTFFLLCWKGISVRSSCGTLQRTTVSISVYSWEESEELGECFYAFHN